MKKLNNILWLNIGVKVIKTSNRPFKNGEKVHTIKGYTLNEQTQLPAYYFEEEDPTYNVEMRRCVEVQSP